MQSNSIYGQEEKTCLLVERVAEVVGVEAPSGRGGGAGGGGCKHEYPPAPRAPGGGRRGRRLRGPAAAEGDGLGRERGVGDEARSTSRRSRHAHESRARLDGGRRRTGGQELVLKGEPRPRPIFAGEGACWRPAATRSRGRQEVGREGGTGARGVEDCGGGY